jgi:tetratricopeptide (TPR) repeat protein
LLLAGVIGGVYGRVLDSPFVFDDSAGIVHNTSIRALWPLWSAAQPTPLHPGPNLPTSARPLVNLTFALNYAVGGLDPRGYHLVNVALHLLAALLLWAIVCRTLLLIDSNQATSRFAGTALGLGFVVALVWCVHPLLTESVAYVTQRTELMMGVCYLGTVYACLRYWLTAAAGRRAMWLTLATLACLAGMFSKEMMASAPAVVLLLERTLRGSFRAALRASWHLYVALALCWIPLALTVAVGERTPSAGFGLGVSAVSWWFTQAQVLVMYLKLCFWPWPQVIHYDLPLLESWSQAWPWVVPVALGVIATFVLAWRKSWIGFVGVSILAVLSPTLVVPLTTEVAAERRMYLPLAAVVALLMVGGYLAAARLVGWRRPQRDGSSRRSVAFVSVLVLSIPLASALGAASARRLSVFQSELALWQDTAEQLPNSYVAQFNLGTSLAGAGRQEEAIGHFRRALELKPDSAESHFNWGRALEQLQAPRDAILHYEEAVRLKPEFAAAHNNLGILLSASGRTQAAIEHYEAALAAEPDFAPAHTNLAAALASLSRAGEAIGHLEEAARLTPNAQTLANLAYGYALIQRPSDAIATIQRAIELAKSQGNLDAAAQYASWLKQYRFQVGAP